MRTENEQDLVCGLNTNDSLEKSNLVMSLSKTWQTCEVKDLSPSCKIFGRSGTMRNGILYQHEALVPSIFEKGCGLLPTPTATQYGSNQSPSKGAKVRPSLETLAKRGKLNLPTPTARDWKDQMSPAAAAAQIEKRNSPTLGLLASAGKLNLPTPTTFDSGNPLSPRKKNSSGGQKPPLVSVIGGKLNPQFVEWLMGYPQDHTKTIENNESNSWEIL